MKLEKLILTEGEAEEQAIEATIASVLTMSVTSHFWHWQAGRGQAHNALGEFYEKMTELADELAEQFMGAGGSFNISVSTEMKPFEVEHAVEELKEFKSNLVEVETALMKDENGPHHGCADTILDVVKEVDKLQYLLTLK